MSKAWQNGSTAAWRRVRAAVLVRDQQRCQLQLDGCTTIATQAHHTRSREQVGDDPAWLLASCAPCNQRAGEPGRGDPAPTPSRWWQ